MRKKLATDIGNRKKFSAVFERLGKKVNFKGYSEETILLKNITDLDTNSVVTDHVWFSFTQGFIKASLTPGDQVEFEARVKEYKKGYVNRSLKINNSTTDFKLNNPTKIKRLP